MHNARGQDCTPHTTLHTALAFNTWSSAFHEQDILYTRGPVGKSVAVVEGAPDTGREAYMGRTYRRVQLRQPMTSQYTIAHCIIYCSTIQATPNS